MWKPIRKVWEAIKGNVYFYLLGVIFSTVGGSALLTSIWKHIQAYRGLPATDSKGLYILCLLISCLILLAWIVARREVKLRTISVTPEGLFFPPQTESLEDADPPAAPLSVDLRGEILEMYFYHPQSWLMFEPMHILCKVRIVNHGPDQATITSVGLEVNLPGFNRIAQIENIPDLWLIRRKTSGLLGYAFNDTTIAPQLGTPAENETYPKGIPRTGWLCFAMHLVTGEDEFPNAEFILHLKDSLGGDHSIGKQLPEAETP